MVAGDICEHPPEQDAGVEPPELTALPARSNGVFAVGCDDVDFDEAGDSRASSTDDKAPRAGSMAELRQRQQTARPHNFHRRESANAVPLSKIP
jgi:hypothetical protein